MALILRVVRSVKIRSFPPNFKETTTDSIKLRFDDSSSTCLTGLSVLLRNAMFICTRYSKFRTRDIR